MSTKTIASISLALALGTATATATPITNSATGLTAPDITIEFNEVALADGTVVTDQFSAYGVEFTPGVSYDNQVSPRPNFSGAAVLDFFGPAISIVFSQTVTEMTANMSQNFGQTTFTSLLNGVVVETFTSTLDLTANNYYGFTNSLFNEVIFDPAGSSSVAMDNLSYTVAPVPTPASLPLLLSGLVGLILFGRRRRAPSSSQPVQFTR